MVAGNRVPQSWLASRSTLIGQIGKDGPDMKLNNGAAFSTANKD